jgi:hypothetical protein
MRGLIALVLCLVVFPALPHPEGEAPESAMLDCEHLPAGSLTVIPKELAPFARLDCTHRGQMLVSGDGWTWRFPGSYFNLPNVASYAPRASQQTAEPRWFTTMSVRSVDAGEREQLHRRFLQELPTYQASAVPGRMLQVSIVNDAGHEFDVFVPFERDDKGWVISCVPDCPPEYVFMMERLGS